MRRVSMFDGGLLAPPEAEQAARAEAISGLAQRLAMTRTRLRLSDPGDDSAPEPAPTPVSAAPAHGPAFPQAWFASAAQAASALPRVHLPGRSQAKTLLQATMICTVGVVGVDALLHWARAHAAEENRAVAAFLPALQLADLPVILPRIDLPSVLDPAPALHAARTLLAALPAAPAAAPAEAPEVVHEAPVRMAEARPALRPAQPLIAAPVFAWRPHLVHVAARPVTPAPLPVHAESHAKFLPHVIVVPHVSMARYDLPRWLTDARASRPAPPVIMSEQPHSLAVYHSSGAQTAAVAPPAEHPAAPAPERRAPEMVAASPHYPPTLPYAPSYSPPRPAYGYGYGPAYAYGGPYAGTPYWASRPPAYPNYPAYPAYQ